MVVPFSHGSRLVTALQDNGTSDSKKSVTDTDAGSLANHEKLDDSSFLEVNHFARLFDLYIYVCMCVLLPKSNLLV